ncbi:hypothetical protein BGZ60DRAFT_13871 [Tricladium varicosporioides]|nr:hypothetical protein BGZ60DRAFT_13871 [Hymenoscyphus varicosporioides]
MITRPFYDNDEPTFRRYSNRGHAYPLSHDRELPPAPSPYHGSRDQSSHETRNNNHALDQDNSTRPRSRIAVACGRCRKRKIKCSGDANNGQPCSSCNAAGVDNCQFLRVSSREAPMKTDQIFDDFDPSSTSRLHCSMVPYGSHAYTMGPSAAVTSEGFYARSGSLSAYPVPSRYYGIPGPFHDYGGENLDYSTSYPLMGTEHLLSGTMATTNPARGWTPTPQLSKATPLYLDQEPFSHGQTAYHPNYQLRPTTSLEVKNVSLTDQTLNTPLPPALAISSGTDRVLPHPNGRLPQVGSYIRPPNTSIPVSQAGFNSYDGLLPPMTVNTPKHSANSTTSENGPSYIPYTSSSPESLNSSQAVYTPQTISTQNETYTPTNENFYTHTNDSSEASYGPSNNDKRSSQNCASEISSGTLVNGYEYVPFKSSSYPLPQAQAETPAALPRRRVSTTISAV